MDLAVMVTESHGSDFASQQAAVMRHYTSLDAAVAAQRQFASRSLISEGWAAMGEQWGLHAVNSRHEVAQLLQQGAPIDGVARIEYGDGRQHMETPLLTALIDGRLEAVAALLDHGANVDAPNAVMSPPGGGFGHMALHMMAQRGDDAAVARLISARADVNARTTLGTSALHLAAGGDYARIVVLLLRAGADPRVREFNSDFPGGLGDRPVDQAGRATRQLLEKLS